MSGRSRHVVNLFEKQNVFPYTSLEEDETKWKELVKKGKEEVQKYLQQEEENLKALSVIQELSSNEKKKNKFFGNLKLMKVV